MDISKKCRKQPSNRINGLDEATWNKEKRNLKKLSRLVLYDIQKLESLCCLELKNQVDFFDEVRRYEINLISTALLQMGGSQRRCASLLGITASTLNHKIKQYGILAFGGAENRI